MTTREAVVAGRFYEASQSSCREQIEQMLPGGRVELELPERIVAGIVPHAGWVFSGALAGLFFAAVKQQMEEVDSFVIFGAVHSRTSAKAMLFDAGQWETPLGAAEIDEQLGGEILQSGGGLIQADRGSHNFEHSIEVQVPIIQYLFPQAKIVPMMVVPFDGAHKVGAVVGQVVAQAAEQSGKKVICVGSTDLTHYGPAYYFTPQGTGEAANRWAKETNDQFFIDLAVSMQADRLVEAAGTYSSACGGGAAAATVAAAKELGAAKGYLLAHESSAEVMARVYKQSSTDSVGYATIAF
ncbi:MAG: AmmeMemoRadiSam system protein B [Sedimentisphaerales bacterium]|nr:AmmeMemoRadiSam system protein B [Sedimentisphaerales bacterium]